MNCIFQRVLVFWAKGGATVEGVKQLQQKGWLPPHVCSWQEEKSADPQPPYSPVLSSRKGKRIASFCGFVKLPTRAWEHTSLTTPMAEDGGFSRQQAQIWSLRKTTMHYTEYACHSCPGSFPFKCELESIKGNELRNPGYYLSVYPPRLLHHHPSACHTLWER